MLKNQWPPDKWLSVSIAPSDGDLEVCVMDKSGSHALAFPVRKSGTDWVDASTKNRIEISAMGHKQISGMACESV